MKVAVIGIGRMKQAIEKNKTYVTLKKNRYD